ncbi:MAG TPA: hemerythrin domain-containing protein [Thermoanaerobaculia bacterium]|nr:hemerythrin domain-containing protein [Thermoanaerobaculia bacterium]
MPNAIKMLESDHATVKKLLDELEGTTSRGIKTRERLLGEIEMEVKIHSTLEEEIFYPAFRDAAEKKDDQQLFFEATEEHHVVDLVLPELKSTDPSTEQFGAKATVLKELIEHHVEEEESQMFPKARKLLGAAALEDLGARMKERKAALEAGWPALREATLGKATRARSRDSEREERRA